MRPPLAVIAVMLSLSFVQVAFARDFGKDCERASLSLNGTWQVLIEHGGEAMWKPEVAAAQKWTDATVPGSLLAGLPRGERPKVKFVWAKKTFTLSDAQAARNVVIRWDGVRFGATAWLNGTLLADHTAVGPARILVPAGIVKPGRNVLLLKVPGWEGVAKNAAGKPLMPTGAATQSWGSKLAAIYYDIWLEFYDRAYMKWVLAVPDVDRGAATFRVWFDSAGKLPGKVTLSAEVRPWKSDEVVGRTQLTVGPGTKTVDVFPPPKPAVAINVPIKDPKLWDLDHRNLYAATLKAFADDKLCDEVTIRFGLRKLEVVDGHYRLNGKLFRFRGSNLVNEWGWGDNFNVARKTYIIDEAHLMNLNAFRTHTCPPPHLWLNTADEGGTFILAEFPLLYNYQDFKFTKEDYEVWHRNAMMDVEGWVTSLWNHPSVALWVLSNESNRDNRWEAGPLNDLVTTLDPTRTTLRTGTPSGTPFNVDIHTCGNWTRGAEGQSILTFTRAAQRRDPKRTLTNTEYMNNYGHPEVKWLGRQGHPDAGLAKAEFCVEHTEAMRRLGFDGMLAYMYAGWTRTRGGHWRDDYPTPMAAALHSSMAPVLASVDLFDRDYAPGRKMSTRVALINDLSEPVKAKVDVYVTPEHPLFIPEESALAKAVWKKSLDVTFKPASIGEMTLDWSLPAKEGDYYLAVVTRRAGASAVVSQRVVRSIAPPREALKGRKVLLLGGDDGIKDWLKSQGATVAAKVADADVALVWDVDKIDEAQRRQLTDPLKKFAEAGSRVAIVEQHAWSWPALVDFKIGRAISSRAFATGGVSHPILKDVDPDWLKRWNGLPGTLADRCIEGEAAKAGKPLIWFESPGKLAALSVATGKGEILVTTLKLKNRLDPKGKEYDPAAERVMVNMLR